MTSTFDLCEKIFDRVTEQFESADVDVANNPIKVTSIPIQPTAAPKKSCSKKRYFSSKLLCFF